LAALGIKNENGGIVSLENMLHTFVMNDFHVIHLVLFISVDHTYNK